MDRFSLDKYNIKTFIKEAEQLGITLIKKELHTTGHASKELIQQIIRITGYPKVYMIHTNIKERIKINK